MIPARCRSIVLIVLLLAGPAAIAGCAATEKVAPLAPQFSVKIPVGTGTPKGMSADPLSGSDQPGALYYDELRESEPVGAIAGVERLSRTVQENVTAPGDVGFADLAGAAGAATQPATQRTQAAGTQPAPAATAAATGPTTRGVPDGQFLVVGGVVAEVNGVPIYANKVITLLEPVLAARAKELNAEQFKAAASKEIALQMVALRNLELEYAAAERNLGEKDRELAKFLTEQWRTRQITAAGGSEQLARRRAAERGDDFDDLVSQQFRLNMSRVYYEKKIVPKVQVTAAEIRAYYNQNRDREFTARGSARFRLIKADVKQSGGREAALEKITAARSRIVNGGQPFEDVARQVNDDPRMLKSGGDLGSAIEQGAFAIEPVERAVWATEIGQVTEIIETPSAFYLAKVESRTPGSVQPFDSEQVQFKIAETLKARDFRAMRQAEQERLVKDAVIKTTKEMMDTAIEMAMQNYPRWAR